MVSWWTFATGCALLGPLAGALLVIGLLSFHELHARSRGPMPGRVARRAGTGLLEDVLSHRDTRLSGATAAGGYRLARPVARARGVELLTEHLAQRRVVLPWVAPVRLSGPAQHARPGRASRPVAGETRAPRPTRLVPLSA
ncbi:MAG: hypothetical protein HY332_03310 [Chloroflexi bacterium]|nr:hypothetical protein [Chloroflexota bacterium]